LYCDHIDPPRVVVEPVANTPSADPQAPHRLLPAQLPHVALWETVNGPFDSFAVAPTKTVQLLEGVSAEDNPPVLRFSRQP
jgi:hypothetical protein